MSAHVGDRLVVEGGRVGASTRHGEILEILNSRGSEHYRVRWDGGEETILYPQSDCQVVGADRPVVDEEVDFTTLRRTSAGGDSASGPTATTTDSNGRTTVELRPAGPTAGRTHGFEMWMAEDDAHTEARVTIQLREVEMTGFGVARRNPHDPQVPQVGEELAMARALSDLAEQLFQLASYQIQRREGRPIEIDF